MAQQRLIKRYANRKMYDTSRSCYVTLEEVADLVRKGCEVRVIDNRTKHDVTEVTLTQALLDSERKNRGTVPLAGLRHLINQGGDFLTRTVAEPVNRVRADAERTVTAWRDEANRAVVAWRSEAERRAEKVLQLRPGAEGEREDSASEAAEAAVGATSASRVGSLVEQTQRAYDEVQNRIDEGIRQAVASLGIDRGKAAREMDELRARVELLEARLKGLEGARSEDVGPDE